MFTVLKSVRHKEQVFIVVRVAWELDDEGRIGESDEIVEPVTSTSLFQASLEAEKNRGHLPEWDLPLMLQK